jgi:hypothetical protein
MALAAVGKRGKHAAPARLADAFQCFHAADAIAPEALKPYLKLRMARTAIDSKVRKKTLRDAYLAGGDRLFQAAKADAKRQGRCLSTADQ